MQSDIVLSSRVRLARNYADLPFDLASEPEQAETCILRTLNALRQAGLEEQYDLLRLRDMSDVSRRAMEESHLVSRDLLRSPETAAVLVKRDSSVSIMMNEDAHLRIQAVRAGDDLLSAAQACFCVDDALSRQNEFAFDQQLGYLTAFPTNAGTGMRASLVLHLPMLTATEQMDRIIGYAGSRGCAVRGTYGEGSQAVGGFYQVSNQVTLGASAAELTDKLVETATTIIDAEKKAREQVRSQNEPALRDRIYRAAGTMKSAYLIDTSEAVQCISDVLIGLQMGILSGMDAQKLYTLEEHIRPAMLTGAPQDRDRKRAEMLREATAGIRFA